MYCADTVLLVLALALVRTKAQSFSKLCGQTLNVTLNKPLRMYLDLPSDSKLDGICRIVVRPLKNEMLMAVTYDIFQSEMAARETLCFTRVVYNENTSYDLCHPVSLPVMDHEIVVEVNDSDRSMINRGVWFYGELKITLFYQAQCQLGAEMCAARDDYTESCPSGKPVETKYGRTYMSETACTDQEAQDCPHRCGVCYNGTINAGACCFSEPYTRDELIADSREIHGIGMCDSHPYGCNELECDYSCEVGKANGPFCVALARTGVQKSGAPGDYHGGHISGGASFRGENNDGGGVEDEVGNNETVTKSGGNEVCWKCVVVVGIILVLNV